MPLGMPITRSQALAPSPLRMKARRSISQTLTRSALSSSATSCAMRFSKPSPAMLEKGRLRGSLQTFSSRPAQTAGHRPSTATQSVLRKLEYIEHPAFADDFLQFTHCVHESFRGRRVAWSEIVGDECARPAADA